MRNIVSLLARISAACRSLREGTASQWELAPRERSARTCSRAISQPSRRGVVHDRRPGAGDPREFPNGRGVSTDKHRRDPGQNIQKEQRKLK